MKSMSLVLKKLTDQTLGDKVVYLSLILRTHLLRGRHTSGHS